MSIKRHIVFLQDLSAHSVREVSLGAAECAAVQSDWSFDPWPVLVGVKGGPSLEDFKSIDGILTTEKVNEHLFAKRDFKTPRVLFLTDVDRPGIPTVGLDEIAIGKMAAQHLRARGYRNLAFVGSSGWRWSIERRLGFTSELESSGLTTSVHEFSLQKVPVFWFWKVKRRNDTLHRVLDSLPRPCGIFAANDVIACFLVQTAREKGFRVPEDIGVVGCDDDPVPNAASGMALSSIRPDFREVGRQAAVLLSRMLRGKDVPTRVLVPPIRVIVRTSTDAFMTEDALVNRAQRYIEERCHQPILVDEVVRALGTNRMTLGKKFHRHLGVGCKEYILKRRIEYACGQLREGALSVDQVAEACGFSSSSYFSRVFKKIAQNTPGRIRSGR